MSNFAGPTQVYYVDAFQGVIPNDTMSLRDSQGSWAAVTVFNASSLSVLLYLNRTPSGSPDYVVAPQSYVAIPTSGFNQLGITFQGTYTPTPGSTQIATITSVFNQLAASSGNIQNTFNVSTSGKLLGSDGISFATVDTVGRLYVLDQRFNQQFLKAVSVTVTNTILYDSGVLDIDSMSDFMIAFVNAGGPAPNIQFTIYNVFDSASTNLQIINQQFNLAVGNTKIWTFGPANTNGPLTRFIRVTGIAVGGASGILTIIGEGRA